MADTETPVVYLDRDQCSHFGADYYAREEVLYIAADTLLRSKDYDTLHQEILSHYGSRTLHLIRTPAQGPGWFQVDAAI